MKTKIAKYSDAVNMKHLKCYACNVNVWMLNTTHTVNVWIDTDMNNANQKTFRFCYTQISNMQMNCVTTTKGDQILLHLKQSLHGQMKLLNNAKRTVSFVLRFKKNNKYKSTLKLQKSTSW